MYTLSVRVIDDRNGVKLVPVLDRIDAGGEHRIMRRGVLDVGNLRLTRQVDAEEPIAVEKFDPALREHARWNQHRCGYGDPLGNRHDRRPHETSA
ncbi:MAG: hypothetical protein GWN29_13200 [Gammaproteobacteria bacterium]|nr:hypothetical protein [Gammaproteobacteria bacterium]